jgi:hypothetical protein
VVLALFCLEDAAVAEGEPITRRVRQQRGVVCRVVVGNDDLE